MLLVAQPKLWQPVPKVSDMQGMPIPSYDSDFFADFALVTVLPRGCMRSGSLNEYLSII